jgi:molybdopterin-guanine dinucleotide biosynthesis protein A
MAVTVAVLAGGMGRRLGGDKALVQLGGRPLIEYPLEAAREAGLDAVVVAKRSTRLPPLDVPVLLEPDEPVHPLLGVITALEKLPAIIAVPCDMPFVDAADLATLAQMPFDVAILRPAQPFPSLYRGAMLPQLREALEARASVRSTQAQSFLAPTATASMREAQPMTVNTPADLAAAERLLSGH